MERSPQRRRRAKPRSVTTAATTKRLPPAPASPQRAAPSLDNIEWLIAGHGDITVGSLGSIKCAATAADQDICYAMLARRDGESLLDLLGRLDRSIAEAADTSVTIDEINWIPARVSRRR